jgi:hypothetical protein
VLLVYALANYWVLLFMSNMRQHSMKKVKTPTCKKELQSFLGNGNYLRRLISNLWGRVKAFTPILQLKNNALFIWGAEQQAAFKEIKEYLSTPLVLKTPQSKVPFRLYVATENDVIGAILIKGAKGKEYIITYVSRRLLDVETRYQFKLRHYLLSSTCIVACQADVIKHMLHMHIMSGRLGKWAYGLV